MVLSVKKKKKNEFLRFFQILGFFFGFFDHFWHFFFFGFFGIFGSFEIFWIFWDFCFGFFHFFGFHSKLLRLLLNDTIVITWHQKSPKMGQNSIKSFFSTMYILAYKPSSATNRDQKMTFDLLFRQNNYIYLFKKCHKFWDMTSRVTFPKSTFLGKVHWTNFFRANC